MAPTAYSVPLLDPISTTTVSLTIMIHRQIKLIVTHGQELKRAKLAYAPIGGEVACTLSHIMYSANHGCHVCIGEQKALSTACYILTSSKKPSPSLVGSCHVIEGS